MSKLPDDIHIAILKYLREFHGIKLNLKHFLGFGGSQEEEYFECIGDNNRRKMKLKKNEARLYRKKISGLQLTDTINLGDPNAIDKIVKHFKEG